jgi:Na+-translocating ferredoxin:NAD+ oxidoreductase RnfG subunit
MLMAGIALVARYDVIEARTSVKRAPTLEELRAVSPEAANATRLDDPIPHYRASVETAAGSVPAAIVSTTALPPAVKGYVDEINTLVVVDDTGAIRGIKVIADRETPEYMRRVLDSGFLERFMGKSVTGASGLDKIDAVTGATITATAIRDDVASAAALAAGRVFNLSAPAPALPSWAEAFKQIRIILVMAALALALYARFGRWPARGRREAAWVVSLFVIGFWAMTPYTMTHICQLLRLDWPGPGNALLLVLASYVLVTTLLFGPLWCACSCPFGALEELLAKLPIKRWKVSPGLMRYAREARFLVLFICVVGVFGLGLPAFSEVEPFGHLFGRTRNPVAWAFIASVLFGAVFIKRFWCRFFCPTGACLMILSSHRRLLRSVGRGVDDAGIDRPDAESPEREE